jgi:hypothetical protein
MMVSIVALALVLAAPASAQTFQKIVDTTQLVRD